MREGYPSGTADQDDRHWSNSGREFVLNADGSILYDHKEVPVSVERFLSTKPLRSEVSTRPGPGGKKLSYMSGDIVTKTLNEAFGFDGWSFQVKETSREESVKDDKGRHHVTYIATVRITHHKSGVYREDCGSGDSIDSKLGVAAGHALKGAITDALKRAARHFGEKLGNSLYHDGFNANKAPVTLKDALETLDVERAKSRFGFDNNKKAKNNDGVSNGPQSNSHATNQSAIAKTSPIVKAEPGQQAPTNQVAAGVSKANQPSAKHNQPSNGINGKGCVSRQSAPFKLESSTFSKNDTKGSNAQKQTTAYSAQFPSASPHGDIGPRNGIATSTKPVFGSNLPSKGGSSFQFDQFVAQPAEKLCNAGMAALGGTEFLSEKENMKPKSQCAGNGLDLPPRPGTSRGVTNIPENHVREFNAPPASIVTPLVGGVAAAGSFQPSYYSDPTQGLKRKNDSMGPSSGAPSMKETASVRNPYNC